MPKKTPVKVRGPYAKSGEQRRRILEVAMDVFGRLGNRGSSLREIAETVGMSQAGVLHHFGSKSELLLAVLEERDVRTTVPDGATLREQAGEARANLAAACDNRGLTQLFTTLSAEATNPEHPARRFFEERYARVLEEFGAPFRAAQAAGEISADLDPEAAARLAVAVMDGLQLQLLLDPEADIMAPFDLLIDVLLRTYQT